jgi:hypothetical protein
MTQQACKTISQGDVAASNAAPLLLLGQHLHLAFSPYPMHVMIE